MKIDVDSLPVRNNEAEGQFEIEVAGELPLLAYFVRGSAIYLVHTEVPESLEGHGLAAKVAQHALDYARANGLTVVPRCPTCGPTCASTRSTPTSSRPRN
jgi:predicted GNAT family acetyltransferase